MASKLRSPFQGKPKTRLKQDRRGIPTVTIMPTVLTPLRAKVADRLATGTAVVQMIWSLLAVYELPQPELLHWGAAAIIPWLCRPVYRVLYRAIARKKTTIVMTPDEFRIPGFWRWKRFDRQLPHQFALLPHDKARTEQRQHEVKTRQAQLNGRAIDKKPYYAESFHISFEYLGQRNDVVTVYGQKDARAILSRLKACDAVMDSFARSGGNGVALRPEDEWGEQPGAIPEEV